MASSQPSDPSQRADNPHSSRHHGRKPQDHLRCHAHGSGSLSGPPPRMPCPWQLPSWRSSAGWAKRARPRTPGSLESQTATNMRQRIYHSRAQGCCGRASQGHRLRIGLCQLPSLRPAATAKLEPSVWSRRAIRHHHRNLRGCKTPAARRATGALLGEAMIDAAAGVQNQLLWRETWFSRPRRLLGRNEWSKPFAVRLG